jgi:sugar transferase (PEP-CTERM system associated)
MEEARVNSPRDPDAPLTEDRLAEIPRGAASAGPGPEATSSPPAGPAPADAPVQPELVRRSAPTLSAANALLLADGALVAVAWAVALWLAQDALPGGTLPGPVPLLLYPAGFLLFLYALGLYRREAMIEPSSALGRVPLAAVLSGAAAYAATIVLPEPVGARGTSVLFGSAVLAFTAAGLSARLLFFLAHRRGAFRRRVLVIGAGRRAWDMAWLLATEGRTIAHEIAFVHEPRLGEIDPRLADAQHGPVFEAEGRFLSIAGHWRPDLIVVAPDERRGMPMADLLACRTAGYPVFEYHRFLEREIGRIDLKRLDIGSLLYAEGFTFSVIDLALKRLLDIVASAVMLVLTAPFLAAAALAVKLQDGGPVLYRQARVTRGGRVFRIMKLRTMTTDAEASGAVWAQKADPRVTRIGRFLRRSRLDELPQLVNVLKGDMSFVGPRPERPEFTAELARELPLYNERHLVRAGLTGWAQVNYPYGASLDDARSKLSYDLYYVKNFSVLFDVLIIAQTLRVVLWPSGAR